MRGEMYSTLEEIHSSLHENFHPGINREQFLPGMKSNLAAIQVLLVSSYH